MIHQSLLVYRSARYLWWAVLLSLASGIEVGIAVMTIDSQVDRYGRTH